MADPAESEITFFVTNISGKAINAYMIRYNSKLGDVTSDGGDLRSSTSDYSILQSSQSENSSISVPSYSKPVEKVVLTVDFVEFTDGTTWGEDKFKTKELLAGRRSGAKAEVERLLSVKEKKGTPALIDIIKSDDFDIQIPPGHSEIWRRGFVEGVKIIHNRLRRANEKGGLAAIEDELTRPFDGLGRR